MTKEINIDEIDYDKMIEYELSCMTDDTFPEELPENLFLDNNIDESDSLEDVLMKISKTHEDFYKSCYDNIADDQILQNNKNDFDSTENTNKILNSFNLTYEDFVKTLSNLKGLDDGPVLVENESGNFPKQDSLIHALINHETVLQKINEEKWNEFDKFFLKFDERCHSARSMSRKEFQEENLIEDTKRKILQNTLDEQLKQLENNIKEEEAENKVRMMELETEIEQEKLILMKLKNESKDNQSFKETWAAIMIQKTFRRYRIRKRIGVQIDETREAAKRKLFNTKLIISEKEAQKQKAAKLRKWRKEQEMNKNAIDIENKNVDIKTKSLACSSKTQSKTPPIILEGSIYLKNEEINHNNENRIDSDEKCEIELKRVSIENFKSEEVEKIYSQSDNAIETEPIKVDDKLDIRFVCLNDKNENNEKSISEINKEYDLPKNNPINNISNNEPMLEIDSDKALIKDSNYLTKEDIKKDSEDKFISLQNNNNNLELCNSLDFHVIDSSQSKDFSDNELTSVTNPDMENSSNIFPQFSGTVEVNLDSHDYMPTDMENANDLDIDSITETESRCDDKITETNGSENVSGNYLNTNSNVGDQCGLSSVTIESITKDEDKPGEFNEIKKILLNEYEPVTGVNNLNIEVHSVYIDMEKDLNDQKKCKNSLIISFDCLNVENINDSMEDRNSEIKDSNNDLVLLKSNLETLNVSDESKSQCDNITNNHIINEDDIKVSNPKSFQGPVQDESGCGQNEQSCHIIDEMFLKREFQNDKVLSACILWMRQNFENNKNLVCYYEVKNDDKQLLPMIPKHCLEYSDLDSVLEKNDYVSVTMEPIGTSPRSCKSVSIVDNQLDSIHELKLRFPAIEYLVLNRNPLRYFQLSNLPESVKYIDISENKLEWVNFGNNLETFLTVLSCASNELSSLPMNAFKNCHNLLHMDFSNNNFLTIESIFKGTNPILRLCSLNLNNNVLSDIENLHSSCPNLTHLSLSGNHLKIWSNTLKFPFLVDCDISHNSLTSLEAWMNTPLLVRLDMSHNGIFDLNSFSNSWLPCLTTLVFDSNKVENIPDLNFITLQNLSIQKNYLRDPLNFEPIFRNCPLLIFIDLKDNMNSEPSKTRDLSNNTIRNVLNPNSSVPIICPEGEFSTACFDFSDIIQQKSIKFKNALRSPSSVELKYKHQVHYCHCTREIAVEFYSWMHDFLFRNKSDNTKSPNLIYSQDHIKCAIKIQSVWRGYRIRKWYKAILSKIKFENEKCFEDLLSVDLSEYDENNLFNNWTPSVIIENPKHAWTQDTQYLMNDNLHVQNIPTNDLKTDEIIISGNESTCGSNSTQALSKKEMEIMKEWGFEDPNSALWMLQRAKKFQKKPNKTSKSSKPPIAQSSQPRNQNFLPSDCRKLQLHQKNISEVVTMSTVTIQPPSNSNITSYRSKIDDWFHENNLVSNGLQLKNAEKQSFLPAIDSENHLKRTPIMYIRPKSSSTRLPSINYVP